MIISCIRVQPKSRENDLSNVLLICLVLWSATERKCGHVTGRERWGDNVNDRNACVAGKLKRTALPQACSVPVQDPCATWILLFLFFFCSATKLYKKICKWEIYTRCSHSSPANKKNRRTCYKHGKMRKLTRSTKLATRHTQRPQFILLLLGWLRTKKKYSTIMIATGFS